MIELENFTDQECKFFKSNYFTIKGNLLKINFPNSSYKISRSFKISKQENTNHNELECSPEEIWFHSDPQRKTTG